MTDKEKKLQSKVLNRIWLGLKAFEIITGLSIKEAEISSIDHHPAKPVDENFRLHVKVRGVVTTFYIKSFMKKIKTFLQGYHLLYYQR